MAANGWYASEADHAHLTPAGYIAVSELGVRQAIAYATVDESEHRSGVTSLSFTFTDDISANLSPDDLELKLAGSGLLMDSFDLAVEWDELTKTATWTFQGLPLGELPVGDYEAKVRLSQLVAGSPDYVYSFTAPALVPEPAAMGLAAGAAAAFAATQRRARR
jgi:hypothetical protein